MAASGIPVLIYHAIDENMGDNPSSQNVSVSLSAFNEQMEWLHREGYKAVTRDELHAYLKHKKVPNGKRVLLTFDDGYHSLYKYAMPAMAKYGFTATLFLSTSFIGKAYDQSDFGFVKHDRQLSWDEIKALIAAGWSIQSHGNKHNRMNALDASAIQEEVTLSKKIIEQNLGTTVDEFAFPYGIYTNKVIKQLKAAGYKFAYSVHSGKLNSSSRKFRLPRIEVNNMDTMERFATKVSTGHISPQEERRAKIRNIIYSNAAIKDLIEKWTPLFGFGNH